ADDVDDALDDAAEARRHAAVQDDEAEAAVADRRGPEFVERCTIGAAGARHVMDRARRRCEQLATDGVAGGRQPPRTQVVAPYIETRPVEAVTREPGEFLGSQILQGGFQRELRTEYASPDHSRALCYERANRCV